MSDNGIKDCGVRGCKFTGIDGSIDGTWRCHGHHKELRDALVREVEIAERRKRLEERFYTEFVLDIHRADYPEALTDAELRTCREQAKRYAAHLVDA